MTITGACILFAWGARHYQSAVRQAEAKATFVALGLHPTYEHQLERPAKTPSRIAIYDCFNSQGLWGRFHDCIEVDLCSNIVVLSAFEEGYQWDRHNADVYAVLKDLPRLRAIDVFDSYFCMEGLNHCVEHTDLKYLSLARTGVTNEDLKVICQLPELRVLIVSGNRKVTDKGALNLAEMTSLELLALYRTGVSPSAVERLRRSLPDCRVVSDGDKWPEELYRRLLFDALKL